MTNEEARQRAQINRLQTGVPGLDEVIGGGLPEYSFNLVAGTPGTGKTTLTQQIMFRLATPERPALHFTVLGEPSIKMLRYQQQFDFFDVSKVEDGSIRFLNLADEASLGDLDGVLQSIRRQVESSNPGLVIVDSFRTIVRAAGSAGESVVELQAFLQELALLLTTWQATTFLVGEYLSSEAHDNPVFTIADGILWLHQAMERNSMVRKLQVLKMRGQSPLPGYHTMRITGSGVEVFPRIIRTTPAAGPRPTDRLSTGIAALDEMLGGGIPAWDAVLLAGPTGSGKSTVATQFVRAGLERGEASVIAVFEERPAEYVERARSSGGVDLQGAIDRGLLEVLYLRPLDLSVDEALLEIESAVRRTGAKRLAIDSLSGFEIALAPGFREDFRESLYRMVGALTGLGVTVLMTAEIPQSFTDLQFSPNLVSFLTDDLILQRYVELDGQLRKAMTVVKMRGGPHSLDFRLYEITDEGLVLGERLAGYRGIITGVPTPSGDGEPLSA